MADVTMGPGDAGEGGTVPNAYLFSVWTAPSGWSKVGGPAAGVSVDTSSIAAGVNDAPLADGDTSYIVTNTPGALAHFLMWNPAVVGGFPTGQVALQVTARVTQGSAVLALGIARENLRTILTSSTQYHGLADYTELVEQEIDEQSYTEFSIDVIANPFGGTMPRYYTHGTYGLQEVSSLGAVLPNPSGGGLYRVCDWAVRLRLVSITGGGELRVTRVALVARSDGARYLTSADQVRVSDAVESYTLKEVSDTVRYAETSEGATLKEVTDGGRGADVVAKSILFRNAIRTGGDRPSQHGGDRPRQS